MDNIKLKDYFNYFFSLMKGDYVPFFNENYNEEKIRSLKKYFFGTFDKNYKTFLKKTLVKYYNNDFDIFLFDSGRSALYSFLKSLDLKKNSEIILPSYSCLGLLEPILQLNLIPHFVDINEDLNISCKSVKKAININTRLIIVPHLGGNYANDLKSIIELSKKNNLIVIEDCCQSLGLKINNNPVGMETDVSFFSVGEGKPIFSLKGGWLLIRKNKFSYKDKKLDEKNKLQIILNIIKFKFKYTNIISVRVFNRLITHLFSLINKLFKGEEKKYKGKIVPKTLSNFECHLILKKFLDIDTNNQTRNIVSKIWKKKLCKRNFLNVGKTINNKLFINVNYGFKKKLILNGIEVEEGYKPLHLRYEFNKFPKSNLSYTNSIWKKIIALPNQNLDKELLIKKLSFVK